MEESEHKRKGMVSMFLPLATIIISFLSDSEVVSSARTQQAPQDRSSAAHSLSSCM